MRSQKEKAADLSASFEKTITGSTGKRYELRLFVTGLTPHSIRAIVNVKKICEEYLRGRYDLEVIDIYKKPELAKTDQIFAAPTLIKKLPPPLRRIIGDMSVTERVLMGLDVREV